jgi:hypothetical protein
MLSQQHVQSHYFKHVHNGIIFNADAFYPMIKFKIEPSTNNSTDNFTDNSTDNSTVFKHSKSNSGWFIIDTVLNKLDGPVNIIAVDKEEISNESISIIINDDSYSDINGFKIDCVSDNPDDLISQSDIPNWMLHSLLEAIYSP